MPPKNCSSILRYVSAQTFPFNKSHLKTKAVRHNYAPHQNYYPVPLTLFAA